MDENKGGKNGLSYLYVLKALKEIPFGVGRKLLTDFLQGNENNESIQRNSLTLCKSFGSLKIDKNEINSMIDNLILNDLIKVSFLEDNKFVKLLNISSKGEKEIISPELYKRKLSFNFSESQTEITDEETRLFDKFEYFLSGYNNSQKKAIIANNDKILCIAGAGSGKTTVLTKRIEFLVKKKYVLPEKILAITFTRKARQEMILRLSKMDSVSDVHVETFNSFCEKILRKYSDMIYGREMRVLGYGDKLSILRKALDSFGIEIKTALDLYFSDTKSKNKTEEQLLNIFLNDCFFIRDYFKFKNKKIAESNFEVYDDEHRKSMNMIIEICNFIDRYMKEHGLRDFADQLIDAIAFFKENKELIPEFEHILIDEYQDVNSTQIEFVDLLNAKNLFCVGDPRQSIYGWRGSDIRYILNFEKKYPKCEIVTLTDNYRSNKKIIDLINESIREMGFADLKAGNSKLDEGEIKLLNFDSELSEFEFVVKEILDSDIPRNEIFVLARTNNQLNELSKVLNQHKIKHVLRSDEIRRTVEAGKDEVTLATIHAIKGLEAEQVFVIGCTNNNFPSKGSEHPIIEMVKVEEYDKEEEEKRLFYVAMSRAKNNLYLTYSGRKPTYFISDGMESIIKGREKRNKLLVGDGEVEKKLITEEDVEDKDILKKLKEWRTAVSKEQGVPAYCIISNRALIEIAATIPKSFESLNEVHGMGAVKIERYGSEILRILSDGV